jgi:YegS/Rv2252/BmrU family lipid kinase
MSARRVHVIVNPASGQPKPILHTLNAVFGKQGVEWDVFITKASGDAQRFTKAAVAAGVDAVAVFGGDGTVMEVAKALHNTPLPMAILPGGTANLLSVELGIPKDLNQAATIAALSDSPVRAVDMGKIGDDYFILRVGLGFPALKVKYADRKLKNRFGILAYSIAGMKAIKDTQKVKYSLNLDGQSYEVEGLACLIDNAGNMGVRSVTHSRQVSVDDGLLDVLVVRDSALIALLTTGAMGDQPREQLFYHWQARQISVNAEPVQPIQVDGEIGWQTPVAISVIPGAVRVLVREKPTS